MPGGLSGRWICLLGHGGRCLLPWGRGEGCIPITPLDDMVEDASSASGMIRGVSPPLGGKAVVANLRGSFAVLSSIRAGCCGINVIPLEKMSLSFLPLGMGRGSSWVSPGEAVAGIPSLGVGRGGLRVSPREAGAA